MSMVTTAGPGRKLAAQTASLTASDTTASSEESSVANKLTGVVPSSHQNPLSPTVRDENCHYFSPNSAAGKPLARVDEEKHIKCLHDFLIKAGVSVGDLDIFWGMMHQGSDSCTKTSNIQGGTKAALAMFNQLSETQRDSVKTKVIAFVKAMVELAGNSGKVTSTNNKLKDFNQVLFKKLGLDDKSANKTKNLDDFCSKYLNQYVYPDIIEKLSLSNKVDADQLKALKEKPGQALLALYSDLNSKNDENSGVVKRYFFQHTGVKDKAYQVHLLITQLEHKTELLARLLLDSMASDSPVASSNADEPDSPSSSPVPDDNLASHATPANGANPLPFSPVNNNNFFIGNIDVINNNDFSINVTLKEEPASHDNLGGQIKQVIPMQNRLSPGIKNENQSAGTKPDVNNTEMGTQTSNTPQESGLPAEVKVEISTTGGDEVDGEGSSRVDTQNSSGEVNLRSSQPPYFKTELTRQINRTFLAEVKVEIPTTGGDEVDGDGSSRVDIQNISGKAKIPYFLSSQPPYFKTELIHQINRTSPADGKVEIPTTGESKVDGAPCVALTNGATVGTVGPERYWKKELRNSSGEADAVAFRTEARAMVEPKKPTYSLNSDGTSFGTKEGVIQRYREGPRVAMSFGAISGSSQSVDYAKSDTNSFTQINSSSTNDQLAEARKSREEQRAKNTKSVNSAGSQFLGLYSTQNPPPINFISKNKTAQYQLDELLNG